MFKHTVRKDVKHRNRTAPPFAKLLVSSVVALLVLGKTKNKNTLYFVTKSTKFNFSITFKMYSTFHTILSKKYFLCILIYAFAFELNNELPHILQNNSFFHMARIINTHDKDLISKTSNKSHSRDSVMNTRSSIYISKSD